MKILFFILAALVGNFQLEWNSTWRTDVPYEVPVDLNKAEAAGSLQVFADGKPLETYMLKDESRWSVLQEVKTRPTVFRFKVPSGTKSLEMRPGKNTVLSSDASDNILSGAEWKADAAARVTEKDGGWLLESTDWKQGTIVCRASVPEGCAGKPVLFEMDCKGISKMTWSSIIYIEQYGADGQRLPETVCDPRWTTLCRPEGKMTPFRETGYIHPKAKSLAVIVRMDAKKHQFDFYGLPLQNVDDGRPQLLVSRLALRTAAQLPFPKYNDSYFAAGVSGAPEDKAMTFDGDRVFWYCARSMAVWAYYPKLYQVRDESECFYPGAAGTVEAWFRPDELKEKKIILLDVNQYRHNKTKNPMGSVLNISYAPESRTINVILRDKFRKHIFKGSCGCELKTGVWQHIAITFEPGAEARLYVDGRKVLGIPLEGYVPLDLKNDQYPNEHHASQIAIGADIMTSFDSYESARLASGVKYYKGAADLLRVSTGARYNADFTPSRSFTLDADTRALFDFNRSFEGVSGGGLGWIPGTVNSFVDKIDHVLAVGDRKIQYYPAELPDEINHAKVLDPRVREISSAADLAASDIRSSLSFDIKPGETKTVKAPEGVYTDCIEIANTGKDVLRYPAILRSDDIDARSYGDIAESLNVPGASDRQKANRFFNFLLKATDYFMTHQMYFDKDSDQPRRTEYKGLFLFNCYCGFECGPLNNCAATLFATAAGCPANLLQGYGHQFEQVYFDGKNCLYDLSQQRFFTAMDNESLGGLQDVEDQEYTIRRSGISAAHFAHSASRPAYGTAVTYPEKFAISLNPGEKIRFCNFNEGAMNDLTMKAGNETHKTVPYQDYTDITHGVRDDVQGLGGVYRIDRFFPEYGNGFLFFEGKPEASNPAFKFVEKDSFCYDVKTCYPVVAADYRATLKNGNTATLELSTDGGKTFRPFTSPATYAVRARLGYVIKVCAPITEVADFKASTEFQFNTRILTGRLQGGDNELKFKANAGTSAKVTYSYRTKGKPITFDGAIEYGTIVGCEKSFVMIEPSKGRTDIPIKGITKNARIVASDGVDAVINFNRGIIGVSSKDTTPHMGWVTVADGKEEKTLCVMVCDGARMIKVGVAMNRKGDAFKAGFQPIKAGEYKVYTLQRFPVDLKSIRSTNAVLKLGTAPEVKVCHSQNSSAEMYKDVMGPDGGTGAWRWDSPLANKWSFPYDSFTVLKTDATGELSVRYEGKDAPLELAYILIVPESGVDFDNDAVKYLFGRNHRPWGVAAASFMPSGKSF